jgi:hypothetical protein
VRKIKAKTKISVVVSITLLISFISIFLSPKFVKSQESYQVIYSNGYAGAITRAPWGSLFCSNFTLSDSGIVTGMEIFILPGYSENVTEARFYIQNNYTVDAEIIWSCSNTTVNTTGRAVCFNETSSLLNPNQEYFYCYRLFGSYGDGTFVQLSSGFYWLNGQLYSPYYAIQTNIYGEFVPSYTEITNCTQITSPGEYRLVNDIIDQNVSECIGINSNDVILDCQGHLIDGVDFYVPGPPEQMSFGIHSHGYNNITIKNCKLSDWSHPLAILYGENVTVLNVEAFSGPWIGPIFDSDNNVYIENLTAYDFGADGLTLRNTTNSYVKNVEIYNCSITGFTIDTGSNNDVVENATVYNMGITGIYVGEDCNSITLRNIVAYSNVYNGLDVRGSNHLLESIETYNTSPDNPGLRINSVNTTLRNIFNHDEYRSIIDGNANNVILEYSKCSNVTYGCWHIFGNNTIVRNNDFPSGIGFFGAYNSEVYNNTLGGLEASDWNGVTPTLINIYNNTFSFKNVQYIRNVFLFNSKIHDNTFYVINDNFGKIAYAVFLLNVTNFEFFNNVMNAYNVSGNSPSWFIPLIRPNATNASFYNNYGYGKYPNAEFIAVSMRATDAEKIYIYNNYVESTDDQCFQLTNGKEQYFYNNTILDGCVWVIGPVSDVYIHDNNISYFDIMGYNNTINNMYAYNNTLRGDSSAAPGVKIEYDDMTYGTKLYGSNIFHPETDTLTPYLSVVLNYSSIDYGTTQPFNSYDYIGGITVNTNMIDYKIEVDSTDLVSGANSISKNNLSFGFNKTLDFNYLLNPYNTITIFKQNLQDIFNILTRLYVPLVAPGTYVGNITITISQGLSDNQIPNPHGGVNVQMV